MSDDLIEARKQSRIKIEYLLSVGLDNIDDISTTLIYSKGSLELE